MTNHNEQLQKIWKKHEESVSTQPATTRDVARWAIAEGLWQPRPMDIEKRCAEELSKAAREEYRTDEQGRRYRVRHSAKVDKNGVQMSFWAEIDKAPRSHMIRAFGQRRKQIVGDCHQLKVDADHYNGIHEHESPVQIVFDFTEDLHEIESLALEAHS